MSPRLSLKVLLVLFIIFSLFLLAVYRLQEEFNAITLRKMEEQLALEKKLKEVDELLGMKVDEKPLNERREELLREDMRLYGRLTPETRKKILELLNEEIRRNRKP